MLNIGDSVYIANYGEGFVRRIELNEICGRIRRHYYISLVSDNIDFFIPEDQLKKYRIKKIVKKEENQNTLSFIRNVSKILW